MDNRDLFKFPFVNRITERNKILAFLNSNPPESVLWISGKSGCGKSRLLEYSLLDYDYISVNREENESSEEYIIKILTSLQKKSNISFVDFLKNNYVSIIDISKNITKILVNVFLKDAILPLQEIASMFFDQSKILVTKHQNAHESISKSIDRYVKAITRNNKFLAIAFDNFSKCSEKEAELLIDLIETHFRQIHFILSTTDEDMKRHPYVERICERLPLTCVKLHNFNNSRYFCEIISSIFEFDRYEYNLSENLFDYCQGSPQNLLNAIRNFYYKELIVLLPEKEKATLDNLQINQLFIQNAGTFRLENHAFREQLVLIIIQQIGIPIDRSLLIDLICYTVEHQLKLQFSPFIKNDIQNVILKFVDAAILIIDLKGVLWFAHDSLPLQIQHEIEDGSYILNTLPQLSNDIVHFLSSIDLIESFERVIAFHSYQAQLYGWQYKVMIYLKKCLQQGFLQDALNMTRKIDCNSELSIELRYIIAMTYYEDGQYKKSEEYLKKALYSQDQLLEVGWYNIFYLAAEIYNILQEKETALDWVLKAIEFAQFDDEKLIAAKSLQFFILLEMGSEECSNQAHQIFSEIETQYSTVEVDMMPRALGKLYRFSCDYYTNSEAKKYLRYSQQIAKKNNDQVEYAFATGNLGFAYMREDNMSNAEKCFEEAIKSLVNLRDHEISYARNNVAVISIKRGQYEEASEILKESYYINRSPYADLAIVVNMLNCFVNMEKQLDNAKSLFLYLSQNEILKNTHDPVIIRKANNALAYSGCFLNNCTSKDIEKYAKKALDYSIGTSSEKVTLNILNNISDKNRPNKPLFSGDYWLLTYSH